MVGRRDVERERDGGEVVEGDGAGCCRDTVDVRTSGASIVWRGSDEDLDRERWVVGEYKLSQLYHGYKVTDSRRRVKNYGIPHDSIEREREGSVYVQFTCIDEI